MCAACDHCLAVRINTTMRFLLVFILSLCLSLNAAYAAGSEVCDVFETEPSEVVLTSAHEQHFGHHLHDHQHTPDADADPAAQKTVHADHCHPHQCFTSVLSGVLRLPTALGRHIPPASAADRLFSASSSRLERPPRASLA